MIDPTEIPIISGNGDAAETPVKFAPCHVETRVALESRYMQERFGSRGRDWTEELHYTSMEFQSVWSIRLADGAQRSVYFDTTGTIYDD